MVIAINVLNVILGITYQMIEKHVLRTLQMVKNMLKIVETTK